MGFMARWRAAASSVTWPIIHQARASWYESAGHSRFHRSWRRWSGNPDALTAIERPRMVSLARALDRNLQSVQTVVDRAVDLVVGDGLVPQVLHPDAERPVREFHEWLEEDADHRGLARGAELQRLIVRDLLLVGDIGTVLTSAHTVQLIDAERIVNPGGTAHVREEIRGGVRLDAEGRVSAYHVAPFTPWGNAPGAGGEWFPAHNFLLVANRPGSAFVRGVPPLQQGFSRMAMLEDSMDAAAIAHVIQAMFALVIHADKPSRQGALMQATTGRGPLDGVPSDGAATEGDRVRKRERLQPMDFGAVLYAARADKVTTVQPTHPNTGLDRYAQLVLSGFAAGLGFPIEVLMMNMRGVNFSQGKLLEYFSSRSARNWRARFIHHWLRPLYRRWLVWRMLEGGGYGPPTRDLLAVRWSGPPRWSADPLRDVQAIREAMALNLTTHRIEARERGLDPDQLLEERAQEVRVQAELGITPPAMPGQVPAGMLNPGTATDEELEAVGLERVDGSDPLDA